MVTKNLILVRGLPGSGKSTFGELIGNPIASDDFFMKNGEYVFDAAKLKDAHETSRIKCEEQMKSNVSPIVVANTFTQEWEMNPYFVLAKKYDYRVHTIIVENRHGGINIHDVPPEKLEIMRGRFEIKL